ncbi:Fe-S cluster assembly protein SufB [Halanaerobium sp. Z-7514]|uniref:Fe-S cluster assembly protein SufB n=1 Tax=Halanaerobium polyolivorans TaxID=2886943 RepID=A0AAW4WX35_9FIRM|nr:Fe-S cluster assembly protein SufB [Halanaerobium polyolivorans]MCC3144348.1 Fe-S cluster assembly protein SufB [Halanaerobium polyolivorans]RQD75490.1 MAG: Fe-S cluster assembly protein SufB [Halanaerobium sp. MSAO_Bac5]
MSEKTQVEDIDRSLHDTKNENKYRYKSEKGLTPEVIKDISREKDEPQWMTDFRLKSLEIYQQKEIPDWGADLSDLNLDEIIAYIRPDADLQSDWDEVPEEIKNTFDSLGIPEAEKKSLAGVGAQYDSEVVYHNLKEELVEQGVIYMDMENAIKEYEDVVKEHFMQLITPNDHKFSALHGAVWSGGSFVYVPAGVKVDIPLQSYFRFNAPGAGQFEHTLIILEEGAEAHFIEGCSAPQYSINNLHAGAVELFVGENASLRYSTIENWSRNMYNLNTKRALVEEDGVIEWVSGSFGSKVSMLYPMSILKGKGARAEFTGVTFAAEGQYLDTGAQVIHAAPHTTSTVNTRSIAKGGGKAYYRGLLKATENAHHAKATVSCESLMLDNDSVSDTLPIMKLETDDIDIGHEAKVGRISEESIYYLMSRGIDEEEAKAMIVRGFVEPIAKELPLEYAVELNNLISLELEGTIG